MASTTSTGTGYVTSPWTKQGNIVNSHYGSQVNKVRTIEQIECPGYLPAVANRRQGAVGIVSPRQPSHGRPGMTRGPRDPADDLHLWSRDRTAVVVASPRRTTLVATEDAPTTYKINPARLFGVVVVPGQPSGGQDHRR
jgi:hypothetical protein